MAAERAAGEAATGATPPEEVASRRNLASRNEES